MSKEQIQAELKSYLTELDKQEKLVLSAHEKFRVVLASTLKLFKNESASLMILQGNSEALKGYLIQQNETLLDMTKSAFQGLRKELETILELT